MTGGSDVDFYSPRTGDSMLMSFRGRDYSEITRGMIEELPEYARNPALQKIKSWFRLFRFFTIRKRLPDRELTYVLFPFTRTQFNLLAEVYKKLDGAAMMISDGITEDITKAARSAGVLFWREEQLVTRREAIRCIKAWSVEKKSKKPKREEELLYDVYWANRKRIILLELYRTALERLVRTTRPKVFLLPEDLSDRALLTVEVARNHRIRVATIQHGLYSPKKILNAYRQGTPSDVYMMFGKFFKKIMIKAGARPNTVRVVGNPLYDSLSKSSKKHEKFTVLFASQKLPQRNRVLKMLRDLASKDIIIIDKLHPAERLDIEEHRKILGGFENVKIVPDGKIEEIIGKTDLLVNMSSTAFMYAVALGKPVVFVGKPEKIPLEKYRVGKVVKGSKELRNFVDELVKNYEKSQKKLSGSRESFIRDFLYRIDGKSGERAASILRKLASGHLRTK